MKKKSKFDEMLAKAKAEKKEEVIPPTPAIPQSQLDALLKQAQDVVEEVAAVIKPEPPVMEKKEDPGPYADIKQARAAKELMKEVLNPDRRKAYNLWYDSPNQIYMLDTLEYEGPTLIDYSSKRLTASQALALAKVKEIFTQKLILRKKGV